MMKNVQLTLDERLVEQVDRVARKLKTSRSAFTRDALRHALTKLRLEAMEQRHRRGYAEKPAGKDEFSIWEGEQAWGDE